MQYVIVMRCYRLHNNLILRYITNHQEVLNYEDLIK